MVMISHPFIPRFPCDPPRYLNPSPLLMHQESTPVDMGVQSTPEIPTKDAPLSVIVETFERLAKSIEASSNGSKDMSVTPFAEACSLFPVLLGCLGVAFKFAEIDFVAKVHDLLEASKQFDTLKDVLDYDILHGSVKKPGSHSRNLRRVRQGLDLIKVLFEQFLTFKGSSLKEPATIAYAQVCAPFHPWAVRKAVAAGFYALPTREHLLLKLNETEYSVVKKMKRYIDASEPLIVYVDKLFLSRNISLDW